MNANHFSLKDAIEKYGIKAIRVLYPNSKTDYSLANMFLAANVGLVLANDDDPKDMVMHRIDEEIWEQNPNYKVRLIPEDHYSVTVFNEDESKAQRLPLYNQTRRMYVCDFESLIMHGHGKIYIETEDGYQLIFGVIKDVVPQEYFKVLQWGQNVLNSLPFHQQTH